jgi:hypothetical protein
MRASRLAPVVETVGTALERVAAVETETPTLVEPAEPSGSLERVSDAVEAKALVAHPFVRERLKYLPAPYTEGLERFIWLRDGDRVAGFEPRDRGQYYGFVFDVDEYCNFTRDALNYIFDELGATCVIFDTVGADAGTDVGAERMGRRAIDTGPAVKNEAGLWHVPPRPCWAWRLWPNAWATAKQGETLDHRKALENSTVPP